MMTKINQNNKTVIVLIFLLLISCDFRTNDKKIEGVWQRERMGKPLVFKGGVINVKGISVVYATYKFVGENTIRYQRKRKRFGENTYREVDWLIKVEFPGKNRMIWYREAGGQKKLLWSFTKISD